MNLHLSEFLTWNTCRWCYICCSIMKKSAHRSCWLFSYSAHLVIVRSLVVKYKQAHMVHIFVLYWYLKILMLQLPFVFELGCHFWLLVVLHDLTGILLVTGSITVLWRKAERFLADVYTSHSYHMPYGILMDVQPPSHWNTGASHSWLFWYFPWGKLQLVEICVLIIEHIFPMYTSFYSSANIALQNCIHNPFNVHFLYADIGNGTCFLASSKWVFQRGLKCPFSC